RHRSSRALGGAAPVPRSRARSLARDGHQRGTLARLSVMRRALLAVAFVVGCKESPPTLTGPATSSSGPAVAASEEKPPVSIAPPNLPTEPPDKDRYPLTDDQIAKIVNPTGATEYSGPTGAIEGVIKVKGDPSPTRTFVTLPKGCEGSSAVHGTVYRAGPK